VVRGVLLRIPGRRGTRTTSSHHTTPHHTTTRDTHTRHNTHTHTTHNTHAQHCSTLASTDLRMLRVVGRGYRS
jgi:hypothetical protein